MKKYINLKDKAYQNLPDFVKSDYPTFVAFLQAYYEFLDKRKTTRNLDYIKDIDNTLPEFIEEIKKEIASVVPQLSKDKLFLKNTKEVYISRGSEESYKLLFRLLYSKNVDIEYPRDKILKPSDGEWVQENSVYLKVSQGNIYDLENDFFELTTIVKNVPQKIKLFCTKINATNVEDVFEVFFSKKYFGDIKIGDVIETDSLIAIVQPTLDNVVIKNKGLGFKVGQIFSVDTISGSGTTVKVTKIGENGEIERVSIISHGVGYSSDFVYSIKNPIQSKSRVDINGNSIKLFDITDYNDDHGAIIKNTYAQTGYSVGDFEGNIIGTFADVSSDANDVAVLLCKIGAVNKYQGYYATTKGLLSYDAFIQDGDFFQDFSYVVKIDEALNSYKQVVMDFIHPVGRKLFGNYLIETDIELFYEISNPIINILIPLFSESNESFYVFDGIISGVDIKTHVADGILTSFATSETTSGVLVSVKINGVTQTQGESFIVENNQIVFSTPPYIGSVIELRTALLNYSNSPLNQEVIVDFDKGGIESFVNQPLDSTTKTFSKNIRDEHLLLDALKFDFRKNTSDLTSTTDVKNTTVIKNILDVFNGDYIELLSFDVHKNSLENLQPQDEDYIDIYKDISDDDNNTIDSNILDVFKKFTDSRTCTDSKKISLEKNTNDTASSFDDLSKLYGTSSFDIYSSIDYTTVGFNKKQNDALDDFSDIYFIDFDKTVYESSLTSESVFFDKNKYLSENIASSDVVGKYTTSQLEDFIYDITDNILCTPNYYFFDATDVSDTLLPFYIYSNISDYVATDDKFSSSDDDLFEFNKNIGDLFSTNDFSSYYLVRDRQENVSSNDTANLNFSRIENENINQQDVYSIYTNKNNLDIINSVESIGLSVIKTPIYDSRTVSESNNINIGKFFGDVNVNSDYILLDQYKNIDDITNVIDNFSKYITISRVDTYTQNDDLLILSAINKIDSVVEDETLNKVMVLPKSEFSNTNDFGEVVKNQYLFTGNKFFSENYLNQEKQIF